MHPSVRTNDRASPRCAAEATLKRLSAKESHAWSTRQGFGLRTERSECCRMVSFRHSTRLCVSSSEKALRPAHSARIQDLAAQVHAEGVRAPNGPSGWEAACSAQPHKLRWRPPFLCCGPSLGGRGKQG